MNTLKLTLCIIVAMAAADIAQGDGSRSGDGDANGRRGSFQAPLMEIKPDEQKAAEDFLQETSPVRWAAYEQIKENRDRPYLSHAIVRSYREMQELKKTDAALYELKLQDIALEDVIFAMVGNHRSETDASKKDAIRSALREKVKALLELRIRERQREIDRLQERQNEEKANFDEFVNQRVRRELEGPEKVVSRADGPRPGRLRQPTTQESPTSVPHAP